MDRSPVVTILAGRTRRLWQPLLQQLRIAHELGQRCVLIVPEHYTLQAERALISGLGTQGLLLAEVLSPSRLIQRVRDRAGTGQRVPVDELGRSMTVMRALEKSRADLWFYYSAASFPGFSPKLARIISAMKESRLTPEALLEHIADWPESALQSKLHDTARVFTAYQELLSNQFADEEDQAQDVFRRLQQSQLFAGAHIFVYGFDMFTQKLCDLITQLSLQARQVLVTIVSDAAQAPDGEAFAPVRDSTQHLMDALAQHNTPYRFVWSDNEAINAPADIMHLERHVLDPTRPRFEQPTHAVRLFAAPSPYAEVRNAAEYIATALRSGVPPSRIMVLCGNFERYQGLLDAVLRDFGIPAYIAEKYPLTSHGLVRATLSALRCLSDGWRREDVLDYLKSGFSVLDGQEVWTLENYADAYGIGGNRWRNPFDRGPEEEREQAEQLRQKLIAPLLELHQGLRKARSATASIQAVLDFLHQTGADTRTLNLERDLLQKGLPEQAIRTRQVWGRLCAMFEQMYALMEDARIPIGRFADWLEAGLAAEHISALPAHAECVQCGDIGRLIPDEPQVMVLLGLNDGILSGANEELLNDREVLEAEARLSTNLGMRGKLKQQMALLDFWKAVSAPVDQLLLSYTLKDEEGNVLRPLGNIAAIRDMLPWLIEEGGALVPEESHVAPLAAVPALDAVAQFLQEGHVPDHWQDAWAHLCHAPEWQDAARNIYTAALGEPPPQRIDKKLADRLYDRSTTSISRLETFAKCPFQHYVQYGLTPQPRKEWLVQPAERGEFYHEVLEAFVRNIPQVQGWPYITQEQTDSVMDTLIPPSLERRVGTPFHDNARTRYAVKAMEDVVRRIAWLITKGAQRSEFVPAMAEVRFGYDIPGSLPPLSLMLGDGSTLTVKGLIDRVDRYAGAAGRYLRVVDYKSRDESLSGENILAGIQLQLLLYLKAALQMDSRYEAAGAFYQHLTDPMINTDDAAKAAAETEKELRYRGIALDDVQVHNLMEDPDQPLSLRTRFKKDGSPYANQPLFTQEEIRAFMDFAQYKAGQLADDILAGAVHRRPAVDKQGRGPCDYCPYMGICRRDAMDGLRDARLLTPLSLRALADSLVSSSQHQE